MRKFLLCLLLALPIILLSLTFNRVDKTHKLLSQQYQDVSVSHLLTPENLRFTRDLLGQNIADLQYILSSYQPLPNLLSLTPDLLDQASILMEFQEQINQLTAQEFLSLSESNPSLYQALSQTAIQFEETLLQAEHILETNYKQVQKLPVLQPIAEVNSIIKFLKHNYTDILSALKLSRQSLTIANNMLGINKPHTYLILIQNNNELRGSGGFLGLLAFLEVDNAQIKSLEFHDIYQFDGLFEGLTSLPIEFVDDNQKLFIRDLNFSPDFQSVASKIEQSLQQAKAPSFDSVIAINHEFFNDLVPYLNTLTINGQDYRPRDNFDFILSYLVESKTHGQTTSKSQISQMLETLPQQLLSNLNPNTLARLLIDSVASRKVQMYSKADDLDQAFRYFDARSTLEAFHQVPDNTNQNFLIFNSVSGTKGDRFIERHITFTDTFFPDHVQTKVEIDFAHTYTNFTEIQLNSQLQSYGLPHLAGDLRFILGRGDYQAFLRAYLPPGASLIDSTLKFHNHIDFHSQLPSFVAGFGMTPGKLTRFDLTYRTPLYLSSAHPSQYSFSAKYQPGLNNAKLTHILNTQGVKLHSYAPKNYQFKNGRLILETPFHQDYQSNFLISPSTESKLSLDKLTDS